MSQFLLPCSCGELLTVGANQAGELIHCRCGQAVEVPTLRELNRLERVADRSAPPAAAWSKNKGLIFLGAIIAALSIGALVYLETRRPPPQETALLKTQVDQFTPAGAWMYWAEISGGISQPLSPRKAYLLEQNQIAWNNWNSFLIASLVLAGIGLLLIIIGLALPRRRPPMATPSASSGQAGPGLR